jgi:hypothetical protein
MALFNAAILLEDTPEEKIIVCDFFKIPEGEKYPTITILVTNKLRELYQRVDKQYRYAPRYVFEKGSKTPIGELSNNPSQFCYELLKEGYKESEGLIDTPSKKAVLALIKKEPGFVKKLASKLVELFEHDELFQDEEEIEKN